jgi:Na+/H+ antiporter NhaD/arsenite permease-like protein
LPTEWIILAVFAAVYAGMALGRWPGLAVDRTGVAMIGAIVLLVTGAVSGREALDALDFPTLAILFTLMVLAGQYAASGLFDLVSRRLTRADRPPRTLLALVIVLGGGMSAVLGNDIVVWTLTPLLVTGLARRGRDPLPYVVALACAANAGSAATVIGNPQNLLIGQAGGLAFWPFLAVCLPPAAAGLAIVHAVVRRSTAFRAGVEAATTGTAPPKAEGGPEIDRPALAKALVATAALLAVFTLADDKAPWALAVAAALLLSRRRSTRDRLADVDWPLLLLFSSLFVVTGALEESPLVRGAAAAFAALEPHGSAPLAAISLAGSNTIGNVPLVMLLLSVVPGWSAQSLHALALFSTLAGNLLIVGSMANIIAVERARAEGVMIGFTDYARIGVPVTLASLLVAWAWMTLAYPLLAGPLGL